MSLLRYYWPICRNCDLLSRCRIRGIVDRVHQIATKNFRQNNFPAFLASYVVI